MNPIQSDNKPNTKPASGSAPNGNYIGSARPSTSQGAQTINQPKTGPQDKTPSGDARKPSSAGDPHNPNDPTYEQNEPYAKK